MVDPTYGGGAGSSVVLVDLGSGCSRAIIRRGIVAATFSDDRLIVARNIDAGRSASGYRIESLRVPSPLC